MTSKKEIDIDEWVGEKSKILSKLDDDLKKVAELEMQAHIALDKATDLLDELGISYDFSISPLSQTYAADREDSKLFQEFKAELVGAIDSSTGDEIDEEGAESILAECFDVFDSGDCGNSGWQHSAICL